MTEASTSAEQLVAEHLRQVLVRHLRTTRVEVWLGKDGIQAHTTTDLAAVLARSLAALVEDGAVAARVVELHDAGVLAALLDEPDPNDW